MTLDTPDCRDLEHVWRVNIVLTLADGKGFMDTIHKAGKSKPTLNTQSGGGGIGF